MKVVVVILLILNIFACNPIQQASQKKNMPQIPFSCLASQSNCEVITDLGVFSVQFSGQADMGKIKTELPFKIQLTFDARDKNVQLKNVSSYIEGKTMFMGKIPVFFQMSDKGSNSTIAQTLLASCSDEVMAWRLWFTVEIEQADMRTKQDFFIDFESKRL